MADNVAITAGAGTSIATDDVSGVHYQRMKLVDGTLDSSTAIPGSANGLYIQGQVAADAAVAGNPVAVGGKTLAWGTAVTAMSADGDAANMLTDRAGIQYVAQHHPNSWRATGEYTAAQTNTSLKAAPGAGLSLYITDVIINTSADITGVKILDGSGGSTLIGFPSLKAGGGAVIQLKTPIKLTANTAMCITTVGTANCTVTVTGYTAA